MFFFGGLSSFLPYILYISVVWICVLIGFRGQVFSILLSNSQDKDELITEAKALSTDENCYVLGYEENENNISQNESIYQKNYFDFFKTRIIVFKYPELYNNAYQAFSISGNSLRAPPYISV